MKLHNILTCKEEEPLQGKADLVVVTDTAYTPGVVAKAVDTLRPFSDIHPSLLQAGCDARESFAQGMQAAKAYELRGSYLILCSNIKTDMAAVIKTLPDLGYDESTTELNNFEKLDRLGEPMLLFCAGFLVEATRRFHVVLAGEEEMAACLLIADIIREDVLMRLNSQNLTLAMTEETLKAKETQIKKMLARLSYTPHALYTDLSMDSLHVKLPKTGEEAGALYYAAANNIADQRLFDEIEVTFYML